MSAALAVTAGCGIAEHLAAVRAFNTPPALSPIAVGVQPFGSVSAGITSLTRDALQDALFAAQAGNRERTLLALQSARAMLANGPAPADGTVTAESIGQMVSDLQGSRIGAQGVAERLQTALPELGLDTPKGP
jgi:hypothetical protein